MNKGVENTEYPHNFYTKVAHEGGVVRRSNEKQERIDDT